MKYLMLIAGLFLTGCMSENEKFYNAHRNSTAISQCIAGHLGSMSESDHVQRWDASLYEVVAKECRRLWEK